MMLEPVCNQVKNTGFQIAPIFRIFANGIFTIYSHLPTNIPISLRYSIMKTPVKHIIRKRDEGNKTDANDDLSKVGKHRHTG